MYSAQNTLKVLISNFASPTSGTTTTTLAALPEGEIGFYTEAGLLLPTGVGTGFFAFRRTDGQVVKSKTFTFTGWTATKNAYAAPTMETQTVTVSTATAGETYQLRIEAQIPGMQGPYFKHGNYVAQTGNTTTDIAAALVTSINAALAREKKTWFTVTSSGAVITIVAVLQDYVRGKKQGRPIVFRSSLTLPEAYAALGVQTVAPSDGIGYGPYICEKEYFAAGDSDHIRFGGYPLSFDDRMLVGSTTGRYDVVDQEIDDIVKTSNGPIYAKQAYLVCFNSIGVTNTPILTGTYAEGNVTPTGFATPGSTVTLYIDGVATGTPVTAHATTGAFTYGSTAVVATDVLTVKATESGATASAASNSITVTA